MYFVRPQEILRYLLVDSTIVTAEIFPRKEGVFAGVQEVYNLLKDKKTNCGTSYVNIFISGGPTPQKISMLYKEPVDAFGVGSDISDASLIEMTLDIKEVVGKPIAKRGRIPGNIENSKLKRMM